jgi:hypothetical protein
MKKKLTTDELARLKALLARLTPEERELLGADSVLEQIAALPHDKRRELAKQIAKFLHNRGVN